MDLRVQNGTYKVIQELVIYAHRSLHILYTSDDCTTNIRQR